MNTQELQHLGSIYIRLGEILKEIREQSKLGAESLALAKAMVEKVNPPVPKNSDPRCCICGWNTGVVAQVDITFACDFKRGVFMHRACFDNLKTFNLP